MQIKPFIPALCWGIIVIVLSLVPGGGKLSWKIFDIFMFDKLGHAGFYAVLSFLIAYGFYQRIPLHREHLIKSFGFSAILGIILEVLQATITAQRHFEFLDILANIIGSILGVAVMQFLAKKF